MPIKDRERRLANQKESYHRHRASYMARNIAKKKGNKEYLDARKADMGCMYCPENDPCCLDFHHRDPKEKSRNVTDIARRGASIESMEVEIAKCDVVCSNCHRKLHAGRDMTG